MIARYNQLLWFRSNGQPIERSQVPHFSLPLREVVDKKIAEKQAWRDKVLAEEHERDRDRKLPDRIELPD